MNKEELYKENILELFRNPHNKRLIMDADMEGKGKNSNCGDSVTLYIKTRDGIVEDASFVGIGCAISQAATSMLTDKITGMKVAELKTITPGDIYTMLGIKISQGRTNCALLGYAAFEHALLGNETSK